MIRYRALVALVFLFARLSAGDSVLRAGMELSYPPFETVCPDGSPCGVSVDMAYALGDYLARPASIVNMAFVGLIPALKSGRVDLVISSMTVTPKRSESIAFSEPYVHTGLCLLISAGSSLQDIDQANQPGRRIVVKSGSSGEVYASRHLPMATIRILDREALCVLEVIQGRADAFIYDQLSVSIVLNDEKLSDKQEALRQYRLQLGIVFQSWNLFPHLTALENIVLPLYRVHGYPLEQATGRSFELLKRFDMQTHAHKKPFALSGGQKQRVAIVRAIAAQPKMLLLDEPTSALDPIMSFEVLELIRELKNDGRDLVLVTHHLHFARSIADYTLFLADSEIVEHGPAAQILANPRSNVAKQYMDRVWATH